jgi:hypothetical protein
MAIQYYMRAWNTNLSQFVDWIVNDKPDSTGIYSGYPTNQLINITVNRAVSSKVENYLQYDQGNTSLANDGYFLHLNAHDFLHASIPTSTVISAPTSLVGIAVTRGGTTDSNGILQPGPSTNYFATLVWDESVARWKFIKNINGDHVTQGAYLPLNTGDITIDGYLAVGTNPSLSGTIRIPNSAWIEARKASNTLDGYLIRLDSLDRVQLGTLSESPIIYIPGNVRIDGYIRDGATNVSTTGFIRNGNATTIITYRDAANTNDLNVIATNASNNILIGNATSTQGNILYNTATGNVHQFQIASTGLFEFGTNSGNFGQFLSGITAPILRQANAGASASGQTLTLQAQNASTSGFNGGILSLTSGSGAGSGVHGSVDLNTGTGNLKVRIFPTIAASASDNNSILFYENLFRVDVAQVSPRIRQDDDTTTSITADTFTIQAQNATGASSTGGNLALTSGTGTTVNGTVNIQTGGTNKIIVYPTSGAGANSNTILMSENILRFDNSQVTPRIRQDDITTASTNGQLFTIQSQNATGATSIGGSLALTSGTGTTAHGQVNIQTGNINKVQIFPTIAQNASDNNSILFSENLFRVDNTQTNPLIRQDDITTASATGQTFTLQAQNATGSSSIGGDLILSSGTGTNRDGYVKVKIGNSNKITVTPTSTIIDTNVIINGTTTTINSTVVDISDRVVHVNSSNPSGTVARPTSITGISIDRGTTSPFNKRNYYGLFWKEGSATIGAAEDNTDGYWIYAINTDGYTTENTLSNTLPVIGSTFVAQPSSAITISAIPTLGGFRVLNNTTALAARNVSGTADLILAGTDNANRLLWGAGTNNAGSIFNTSSGTVFDFQVASASQVQITTSNINFDTAVSSPIVSQNDTTSASGQTFTLRAQNATTTGGNLKLSSGTGTVRDGYVLITNGTTTRVTFAPTIATLNYKTEAFDGYVQNPIITQNNGNSTLDGYSFTIKSQSSILPFKFGGDLILSSGDGYSGDGHYRDGYIRLYSGSVEQARIVPNKFFMVSGQRVKLTHIDSGTDAYVAENDYTIMVNTSAARHIYLPANPIEGDFYQIKDKTGTANTFNITINGNGKNIDGSPTYVINTNYASVKLIYNNTQWSIM